jgi:chemotaxis protein CheX
MSTPQQQKPQLVLDERLADIATKSAQKAIESLFNMKVRPGSVTMRKDYVSQGDISGILGMVQESIEATMVLSFKKETVFALLGKLYGRKYDQIENSVKQGVGELTNIVYASMKKELNYKGHSFKMSIPSVVIGTGHSVIAMHEGDSMVIPFTIEDAGEFFMQITLQNSR